MKTPWKLKEFKDWFEWLWNYTPPPPPKKPRPEDTNYIERLEEIETELSKYNSGFDDFNELRTALDWARSMPARGVPKNADDFIADPLKIVSKLIHYGRADRETILAAILYPAVMPIEGEEFNFSTYEAIGKKFPGKDKGIRLLRLIARTLDFRALNIPLLGFNSKDAEEETKEIVRQFRLMSLWAAKGEPRAILIAAVQNIINLQNAARDVNKKIYSDAVRERLIINAEQVYIPLAYIAGYEQVYEDLRDLCYRLKDPQGHDAISKTMREQRDSIEVKEIEALVRNKIVEHLQGKYHARGWMQGTHFEISFRQKSITSIREKLDKKNKTRADDERLSVGDLADLFGVRIKLKLPAIYMYDQDKDNLSDEDRARATEAFTILAAEVHESLAVEFGRWNGDNAHPKIKERFKQLANAEPRHEDPARLEDPDRMAKEAQLYAEMEGSRGELYRKIEDSRFENYYALPKKSGVQFIKDLLMFRRKKNEGYWEIETQVIDELQYDIFMYGPRAGHIYYKTDLAEHFSPVDHWRHTSKYEVNGETHNTPEHVYVWYGDKPVDISDEPTLAGLLKKVDPNGQCEYAQLHNLTSFSARLEMLQKKLAASEPVTFPEDMVMSKMVSVAGNDNLNIPLRNAARVKPMFSRLAA